MKIRSACSRIALIAGLFSCAATAHADTIDSVSVLLQFSELLSTEEGRTLLEQNLEASVGTNNNATDAQRAQAISDNTVNALIGGFLSAENLSDALGSELNEALTALNADHELSSDYTRLLTAVNLLAQGASSTAKTFYANGTSDGSTPLDAIDLPDGGSFNIYDQAYGVVDGNPLGNSRPYQASDDIQTFTGTDYYGQSVDTETDILSTLGENSSFPSGHTTYGITSSLMLAILVPERYQELVTRGLEFGNSRVVLGAHYALDVIGARVLAYKTLADILNNDPAYLNQELDFHGYLSATTPSDFSTLVESAGSEVRAQLEDVCGDTIANCIAASGEDRFSDAEDNEANYTAWLTYGMDAIGDTTLDPVVPEGAEVLIASRFPYLTEAQLAEVLATTKLPSGYVFDDGSGWARLNLYAAANGYGAFENDVTVVMDADDGGFSAADTWANDISGAGGLIKQGSGSLELTGENTYAGDTVVEGGKLVVNGRLANSEVTVSGGALGGSGTVAGLVVADGGTVAAGNSIGTLSVDGDATFEAGSTLEVEADAEGHADLVAVSGAATLEGGDVVVDAEAGTYDWKTDYLILAAEDGIDGAFDSISTNFAFLDGTLAYSETAVTMTLTRNDLTFSDAAETDNQAAVAEALEALDEEETLYAAMMTATAAEAAAAFDGLSGSFYPGLDTLVMTAGLNFGTEMQERIDSGAGAWATVYGRRTSLTSNDEVADLDATLHGFEFGYNWALDNGWTLGLAGSALDGSADGARGEEADLTTYGFGLMAEKTMGNMTLQLGGNMSFADVGVERALTLGDASDALKGDYDATATVIFAEMSKELSTSFGALTPFGGLSYVSLSADGVSETGGDAALNVNDSDPSGLFSTLGLRLERPQTAAQDMTLSGAVAWKHGLDIDDAARDVTLLGTDMTVVGQSLAKDTLQVELGIGYQMSRNGTLNVAYSGEFSDDVTSNALKLKLAWEF